MLSLSESPICFPSINMMDRFVSGSSRNSTVNVRGNLSRTSYFPSRFTGPPSSKMELAFAKFCSATSPNYGGRGSVRRKTRGGWGCPTREWPTRAVVRGTYGAAPPTALTTTLRDADRGGDAPHSYRLCAPAQVAWSRRPSLAPRERSACGQPARRKPPVQTSVCRTAQSRR